MDGAICRGIEKDNTRAVDSFPRAAITNYHKLGKTTEINSLTVLETRSPKSKYQQGWRLWGRVCSMLLS